MVGVSSHRVLLRTSDGLKANNVLCADREAQRNIRRRTKEQIENLEKQIADLTSQQPYQEFLAMKRVKEAAEKENADIKQRLAAIIGEVQGLIGGGELPSTLYAAHN